MDKLLIGVTYVRPGQLPASRDLTFNVTPGQGLVLLDPGVSPTLGAISNGRLVIASENFPRYAPLTLTLGGADFSFRIRRGRLISFALTDRGDELLKFHCTGIWTAAYRYRLSWPTVGDKRVEVTRINGLEKGLDGNDRETTLGIHVLSGDIAGSADLTKSSGGTLEYGRVDVRRDNSGELKLQMHGARMEWGFAGGMLIEMRLFDSQGAVANLRTLDLSGAGVGASVAVVDTLP